MARFEAAGPVFIDRNIAGFAIREIMYPGGFELGRHCHAFKRFSGLTPARYGRIHRPH